MSSPQVLKFVWLLLSKDTLEYSIEYSIEPRADNADITGKVRPDRQLNARDDQLIVLIGDESGE